MSRRWLSSSAFALVFLAALAWWAWDDLRPKRLNVLVLTVESTRAADVTPENLPHVFQAAEGALRFENHRAVSAWTAPNILAILTGLSSFAQGVHARDQALPEGGHQPLDDLARAGWRVAGLQSFMLTSVFDNMGMAFEPGANLVPWLARARREGRPFLLWHHYLETHLPYAPAAPFAPDWRALMPPDDTGAVARIETVRTEAVIPAGTVAFKPSDRAAIRALYLGNLRAFDAWFAELWRFLDHSGLRANTIVVLTADHGEEHLERGLVGHASTTRDGHLHEEIVRLPLFVWLPPSLGIKAESFRHETRHTDILPSVLHWLGRGAAPLGFGLFATEARAWSAVSSRAGFAEPDPANISAFVFARKEGDWKFHLHMEGERVVRRALFDLATDPGERVNLVSREGERARRMEAAILAERGAMQPPRMTEARAERVAERPTWFFPAASGPLDYAAFDGRVRLEWTGHPKGAYVLQYEAGEGARMLAGELRVVGTAKDFGRVERDYWNTFIVPYRVFRVRVGPEGRADLWSPWLDLQARPAP